MSDEIIVTPPAPINVTVTPSVGIQGPVGATGATGPQGITGSTGATGPTGVVTAVSPLIYDVNSQSVSLATTAATTNGTYYGSATAVPTFTVDNFGRLTSALNVNIAIPGSQVTSTVSAATTAQSAVSLSGTILATQVSGTALTQSTQFGGDVTGTAGSITLTTQSGLSQGTYTKLTVSTKGLVTGATNLSASDIPAINATQVTNTAAVLSTTASQSFQGPIVASTVTATNASFSGTLTAATGVLTSLTATNATVNSTMTAAAVVASTITATSVTGTNVTVGSTLTAASVVSSTITATNATVNGTLTASDSTFSGTLTANWRLQVNNGNSGNTPLIVKGASGQSVDLLKIQDNTPTDRFTVSSAGALTVSPSAGTAGLFNGVSNTAILQIKPESTRTSGNSLELYDPSGNARAKFDRLGGYQGPAAYFDGSSTAVTLNNISAVLTVTPASASNIAVRVRGLSGQYGNLQTWDSWDGTTNTIVGGRNAVGQTWSGSTSPVTVSINATASSSSYLSPNFTLTLPAASGLAVGDLITVQNLTFTGTNPNGTFLVTAASNTNPFSVSYNPGGNPGTVGGFAANTILVPAQASFTARSAGTVGLVARAAASPVANLQEWQNSSGTVLAKVDFQGSLAVNDNNITPTNLSYALRVKQNSVFDAGAVTVVPVNVWARTGQTANLTNWYSDQGTTIVGGVSAVGHLYSGQTSPQISLCGANLKATGTSSANMVTITTNDASGTPTAHNLTVNDIVIISNFTPAGYNGTYVVGTVPSTTTFQVTNPTASMANGSGGTVGLPAQASFVSRSAGTVPLIAKTAGQDIARFQNSSGSTVAAFDSAGILKVTQVSGYSDGLTAITLPGSRSVQLASSTGSLGGGAGVVGIANATTVPTGTAAAGLIIYANSGALGFTGTSLPNAGTAGTSVTVVNSDGTSGNLPISISSITVASYTPLLTDSGKNIEVNTTVANLISIPTDATTNFPIGAQFTVVRANTGTVTITAATPATTNLRYYSPTSAVTGAALKGQWAAATVIKRAANDWLVIGNLT